MAASGDPSTLHDLAFERDQANACWQNYREYAEKIATVVDEMRENSFVHEDPTVARLRAANERDAAEWNAGHDAFEAGVPITDEPDEISEDMWRPGWLHACFGVRGDTEMDALLSRIAITEAERDEALLASSELATMANGMTRRCEALMTERDALKELLRDAREFVAHSASCPGSPSAFTQDVLDMVARIDAAIGKAD